jgi:hypothetical protein
MLSLMDIPEIERVAQTFDIMIEDTCVIVIEILTLLRLVYNAKPILMVGWIFIERKHLMMMSSLLYFKLNRLVFLRFLEIFITFKEKCSCRKGVLSRNIFLFIGFIFLTQTSLDRGFILNFNIILI